MPNRTSMARTHGATANSYYGRKHLLYQSMLTSLSDFSTKFSFQNSASIYLPHFKI
jgi:hypothetical protein